MLVEFVEKIVMYYWRRRCVLTKRREQIQTIDHVRLDLLLDRVAGVLLGGLARGLRLQLHQDLGGVLQQLRLPVPAQQLAHLLVAAQLHIPGNNNNNNK